MATTYTKISSTLLSAPTTTITFSAIPAIYTDLLLKISARTDSTGTQVAIYCNDNASYDSMVYLQGNGSTVTSGTSAEPGTIWARAASASGSTSNTFGSGEAYIANYADNSIKPIYYFALNENAATSALINATAGTYSEGIPITSIVIRNPQTNNFVSGSIFTLYGIASS